jgi:hypothetical protein
MIDSPEHRQLSFPLEKVSLAFWRTRLRPFTNSSYE